ncbi:MAG: glutamate synthase central domain-containing protein, partial [Candidatus Methylomirabilota bacterium]
MQDAGFPPAQGLYDPTLERDSCGVGFVVNIKGRSSHDIVVKALTVLKNLLHRGACGSESNTGDGAGILLQLPDAFLRRETRRAGIDLPPAPHYAVGMVCLPQDPGERLACQAMLDRIAREEGQVPLGWRDVPTDRSPIGESARRAEPIYRQVFIGRGGVIRDSEHFERILYLIRKRVENGVLTSDLRQKPFFYIGSLSCRTIVYKGMLSADQMEVYFPDLGDPSVESALALVHQRFSTNTFPTWSLAHPFRYLAHNGEINTLRGNRNWMYARQALFESELYGDRIRDILPVIREGGSDSASLDNALEMLVMCGRSLPHAVMMLIPEAWNRHEGMSASKKAFYEYHACLMEPWDGPASVSFTDGRVIGAVLDRNGLRPSRYYVTTDDLLILASEVGVLDIPPEQVLRKERLQPGRMLLVDTVAGRIIDDDELKEQIAAAAPYGDWLQQQRLSIDALPSAPAQEPDRETVLRRQQLFGYTHEDLRVLLAPMATSGQEPIGSMGNDASLAVLSDRPRMLYDYFKQLFAQVTNPPLDAIREELVTSLESTLGPEGNLLTAAPESCHQIALPDPILDNPQTARLHNLATQGFRSLTLPMLFPVREGAAGMARALEQLCRNAGQAIERGYNILILSDRGVDLERAPIPALLATAGVHHHLIRRGMRTRAGLLIETGEAREVHHCALLLGYGAGAVNPYLALETLEGMQRSGALPEGMTHETAVKNYLKALSKGILKVMSKMGISTVQSYRGAQIFEAVGLNQEFVDNYFTWTASRVGGVDLGVIAEEVARRHRRAFPDRPVKTPDLEGGGEYQWRQEGENHLFNPDTIFKLQHACRSGQYAIFKEYSRLVNDQSRRL